MAPGVTHPHRVSRPRYGARKQEFCLGSMHIRSFRIGGVSGILCRSFKYGWWVGENRMLFWRDCLHLWVLRRKIIYLCNGGYTGCLLSLFNGRHLGGFNSNSKWGSREFLFEGTHAIGRYLFGSHRLHLRQREWGHIRSDEIGILCIGWAHVKVNGKKWFRVLLCFTNALGWIA